LYDLAMAVLIGGQSVREITTAYGLRSNGEASKRLATALHRYTQLHKQPPAEPEKWPHQVDVPAQG